MKKMSAVILSAIIFIMGILNSGAVDFDYKDSDLFDKYSSFEILKMYPEATKYIAEELRKYNTDISLRDFNISVNDIGAIFYSVVCENPDIFYVHISDFESTSENDTGKLVSIRPYYIFEPDKIPEKKEKFDKAVNYILSGVDKSWSDVYKCRYLHDMINQYVEYDMDVKNNDPNLRTAYGALIDNIAVCDGYTLAYNYLLGKLGIEAHYVQSLKMVHAWSMVKIGGKYYHVDTTYDDPSYDTLGKSLHSYCLVSDTELKADKVHHDWITSAKASDKSLDSVWWRNISTFIFPINGYDYYVNQKYGSSVYGALMKREISSGTSKVVEKVTTRWTLEDNSDAFWEKAYCCLTFDGNYIYYNDTKTVYRYKPDGSANYEVLYKKPSALRHNIYGIALNMESKLYISIKSSPNVKDVVYYIDKNVINQNSDADNPDDDAEYYDVEGGVALRKLNENAENVIIPSAYNGKKVVAIGDNAFSGNKNLKSIIIPEGVVSIGSSAFYNCSNLSSVLLPESLKTIGAAAFNGCSALKTLTVLKGVTKIEKNVFSGCIHLTLKGYSGSAAESYATLYKISFEYLDNTKSATKPPTVKTKTTAKKSKTTLSQKYSMYVKQTAKISGLGKVIKCSTSKKSVATVSKKGVMTAKKKGKAVIKIEDNKYIYKTILTVKNPKLNASKKTLKKGKTFKLKIKGKVGKAKFKSSNKKVATVSGTGKIKAKKKGKATITVTTNGKVKLKCKITVKKK